VLLCYVLPSDGDPDCRRRFHDEVAQGPFVSGVFSEGARSSFFFLLLDFFALFE